MTPAAQPDSPHQHLPVRVRAVLLTGHGSIIVLGRHRPGRAPYRVLPGGAVEATDPSTEAALARELREELGAQAVIGPRLATITAAMPDGTTAIQHLHLAHLVALDPSQATAPEYADPATGTYNPRGTPPRPHRHPSGQPATKASRRPAHRPTPRPRTIRPAPLTHTRPQPRNRNRWIQAKAASKHPVRSTSASRWGGDPAARAPGPAQHGRLGVQRSSSDPPAPPVSVCAEATRPCRALGRWSTNAATIPTRG
jgi:8-oxo-dGTP pyrophosphatase MutT (NUDIX family)